MPPQRRLSWEEPSSWLGRILWWWKLWIGKCVLNRRLTTSGREIKFGTALGEILHHNRLRDTDDRSHEIYREKGKTTVPDTSSWVWWGKPLWHDMGYLAVGRCCSHWLMTQAIIQLAAATIFWISTLCVLSANLSLTSRTGLPGVIPGFSTGEGSTAIVDVFFWSPQGRILYQSCSDVQFSAV